MGTRLSDIRANTRRIGRYALDSRAVLTSQNAIDENWVDNLQQIPKPDRETFPGGAQLKLTPLTSDWIGSSLFS